MILNTYIFKVIMNRLIELTEKRIDRAKTKKGGYRNAQFITLGLEVPAKKGWKKKLTGTKISLRKFINFVEASGNKSYLAEITDALPTLNPPVLDQLSSFLNDNKNDIKEQATKSKLTKKESKKERTKNKKAQNNAERVKRIRDYGIEKTVDLIHDKFDNCISFIERQLIKSLRGRKEDSIPSSEIIRLYIVLKKNGIIFSRRRNGTVTSSGFTKVSLVKKEQMLYIIREKETNSFKIGVSKNPKSRLKELQTANPNTLFISLLFDTQKNAVILEKFLHKHFRKKRKKGEWFADILNDEIIKIIGDRATSIN